MPEKEAETYHINPFDLTKVWPHKDYPLIEVGELVLEPQPGELLRRSRAGGFRTEEHRARHGLLARQDAAGAAVLLSGRAPLPPRRELRPAAGQQAAVPRAHLQSRRRDAVRW